MAYTEQSNPTTTYTEQGFYCNNTIIYCNSTRYYCDGHLIYTEQSNPSTSYTEQSNPST